MTCAPSEDSDQPVHPPSLTSLIRVFAVRLKKALVLSYPLSARRRLISLGADLSLRWAHRSFCWFCHETAHVSFFYISKEDRLCSSHVNFSFIRGMLGFLRRSIDLIFVKYYVVRFHFAHFCVIMINYPLPHGVKIIFPREVNNVNFR